MKRKDLSSLFRHLLHMIVTRVETRHRRVFFFLVWLQRLPKVLELPNFAVSLSLSISVKKQKRIEGKSTLLILLILIYYFNEIHTQVFFFWVSFFLCSVYFFLILLIS